jgi:hypothetical protein
MLYFDGNRKKSTVKRESERRFYFSEYILLTVNTFLTEGKSHFDVETTRTKTARRSCAAFLNRERNDTFRDKTGNPANCHHIQYVQQRKFPILRTCDPILNSKRESIDI